MATTFRGARVGVVLTLSWMLACCTARAEGADDVGGDQDVALRARQRGEILPLKALLLELSKTTQDEVIGIEIERDHETWVYKMKVIPPGSTQLRVVSVDARTGKIRPDSGR
jgi:uncharacterized membrane protein YkoI